MTSRPSRQSPGWGKPLRLLIRLVLMGVGLGLLTGSALRWLAPEVQRQSINLPPWLGAERTQEGETESKPVADPGRTMPRLTRGSFRPSTEITALSMRWKEIASLQSDLQASAYMLILDDGRYAQLQANRPMPAASSIKTPVLLAAMERIDADDLHWNEPLTLTEELVGGEAGWMASRPLGSRFPTYQVATEMIRISDNTATNLLIERAGGQDVVNARFRALGLTSTAINNWLPDLEGSNTTSAHDLSRTFALVDSGDVLSPRNRDLFRQVMATSVTNTLIPTGLMQGLGGAKGPADSNLARKGYRVLNKTGDIGIAYADAALIEIPDGRRAVAAFLVKGPFNDPRSTALIRAMAKAMAVHLKPKPAPPRKPPTTLTP